MSDTDPRALEALLDTIIPASSDGKHPAAGALGIGAAIEQSAEGDPTLRASLDRALQLLAAAATREGAEGFASLAEGDRHELLQELATAEPELVQGLLPPVYTAYYQRPEVARAIGMESWPPHPGGFEVESGDLSLLDPVRQRGELWRRI